MARRRYISFLLLLTFSVGGVLAPASHHLFMAVSEAYVPWRHGDTTDSHRAAAPMPMPGEDGEAALRPEHPAHAPCEYAALFATLVLAPHAPTTFTALPAPSVPLPSPPPARHVHEREVLPISERGPPPG
ncbi:hypothetical protein GQ464_016920 [Rhodocaloribacter litoris]|uniref:hypothetical protein n=1 Tax=Rhodocaloribacter litoris TaxID=2558931 RepID=UPI0014230999|nr:hypothetical protein [Rhodocaloribacter litoris]QXD15067.1 hypothetical protein GQ464_016920 [Rhodocaloribacter litoris]GIV62139.1 MAG: hypothetical protein KatS3mg044_1005 [Rhodothermaceae bacterium]